MELGLNTPVVTMLPGVASDWERAGTIEDVARIAETADALGYDFLSCSEHIGVPATEAPRRGARYWDPLSTFGYLAARTQRIRFATMVVVLGYHHPLELAKRYGTLDVVSGGRLVLGLGVGTLREEFDLLGAPFDDRGARADDALKALRASLSQTEPSYSGEYYEFGGLVVDPCAVQPRVPLWIGGRTLKSLRRAASLADGWSPFAVTLDQVAEWLPQVERTDDFEVVLGTADKIDPVNDPAGTEKALLALHEVGATTMNAQFVHTSLEHYLEQLEALTSVRTSTFGG